MSIHSSLVDLNIRQSVSLTVTRSRSALLGLFPAELIAELYPRKPQMVEQKVLPLLWHLLGSSTHSGNVHGRGGSVRAATASLCQALYAHMGPGLVDCAASQHTNVHKHLNEVLRSFENPKH